MSPATRPCFYLGGTYGRRRVCNYRKGVDDVSKLKFVKHDSFAAGFMAWASVSFHDKSDIRIIDKGVKVNSDFYINKVLKPSVNNDVPRMFPGDQIKDMFSTRIVHTVILQNTH